MLRALLIILPFFLLSQNTYADFRVCNTTSNSVGVAIGYKGKSGWKSEGWWHIDRFSCKVLIKSDLASRYYYLYAEDVERGGRWDGPIGMCVAEEEFSIEGISDCIPRGYQRAGFQEHDTKGKTSWMVQLTEVPGREKSAPSEKPH